MSDNIFTAALFDFAVPSTRYKVIPNTELVSTVPETHRGIEEVQCPGCTAWIRPDRGCFRCDRKE